MFFSGLDTSGRPATGHGSGGYTDIGSYSLWVTDGTAAGTQELRGVAPLFGSFSLAVAVSDAPLTLAAAEKGAADGVVTFPPAVGVQAPLVINGDAIAIRGNTSKVATVVDGKIHWVPVTIGRDFGSETEIVNGLKAGDIIVTDVTDEVVEGAEVEMHTAKGAEQQSTAPKQSVPLGGSTQYGAHPSRPRAQGRHGPCADPRAGQRARNRRGGLLRHLQRRLPAAPAFPAPEDTPWTHGGPPPQYVPSDDDAREDWS